VNCDPIRDLISARTDGEATAEEQRVVDHHLAVCAACRHYAERLAALERLVRVRPAEPVPDLVGAVTARARPARLGRGGWLRPALAWVAIVMFAQSVPALVWGAADGTEQHMARHLGAFGVALAAGFAFAAWKPHRAFGLLPFTVALVATTLVSIPADVLGSGRSALAEMLHLTELAGLTLLWMIAGSPGWRRRSRTRRLPRLDPLQ
jgi:predicted anti-sigma-YlaC factor YlaD